jgi:CRP-like cAMP-binding protein
VKGATIFWEGEQGTEFFVVVRGQVEISSGKDFSAETSSRVDKPTQTGISGPDIPVSWS